LIVLEALPVKYELIDKVKLWGTEIVDPLAIKDLSDAENSDDEIIQTTHKERLDNRKNEKAARKINKTFEDINKIKVGY
jgi:hypothetical protein